MALIDEIRRRNPSLRETSDNEIKSLIRTSPEFQYFSDEEFEAYVGGGEPAARDATPGFTGGFAAGIDQLQAMGGGLVMAAGEALESEGILNAGRDIYQRNMDEAAENDLGYGFTDIRSAGDAWNWASYTAGNLLPMMATSIAGGGVGGVAAGVTARTLAGAAAKEGAKRAGQALGAFGASAGMETGALMGETEDLDVSLAHGTLAGALDAVTPVRLLRSAGKGELADRAASEISDRVLDDLRRQAGRTARGAAGRGSLTNLIAEASTEGLQGLISQHANYWVENNGDSLLANLGEVDVKAMIDEAAAGGLMGGIMGAPAGLGERGQARRQVDQIEAAREQAAAQGGDSLDQAQAAQAAEQASQPEREPVDPSVSAEVGNRLQLAMGELDDLQNLARGSSYQGQTRLRNISTILDRAERAFEEGNVEQARRLTERADVISRNLRAALEREGTAERPARPEGELVDEQGVAGLIGRGGRQAQLPPGDPDTIFAGGPTADTTQYDPQARHVRRDEGLAGQREAEARMREQASQQRPQIPDQGIVYGEGPVAGNANTGLDQPFPRARFTDTGSGQDSRAARTRQQQQAEEVARLARTRGRGETAYLPDNTPVRARFRVMDLLELTTSNTPDGRVNPAFPQELQPRDRTGANSQVQVRNIAARLNPERLGSSRDAGTGAPIIGADGVVESGNGRTMAIATAYQQGGPQAQAYRDFVRREAAAQGIDPAAVDEMTQPVLVRERVTNIDRADFARRANEANVAGMTAYEQALADADSLTAEDLQAWAPDQSGDPLAASNRGFQRGFVRRLGNNEAARYTTRDGQASPELGARMQRAVFAKAYADSDLVALTTEQGELMRNLTAALQEAAPDLALARETGSQEARDAIGTINDAVRLVRRARQDGISVRELTRQNDAFTQPVPEATALLAVTFHNNLRSRRALAEGMRYIGQAVRRRAESEHNGALFEDTTTNRDVFDAAFQREDQDQRAEQRQPEGDVRPGAERGQREPAQGRQAEAAPGAEGRQEGRQSEAVGDGPLLATYDEQELAAQEREQQQAEQVEAERHRQEAQRAQADTEADDFRLAGSDRAADVAMAGGQQDLMGAQPGAEAEPAPEAPAENARDAAESPDDSAPKPKRRNKPLSYTGYSGEERQVRSYQEVGDYRIAKVHDGLYEVIDGRDQAISQMAGPNGAAREARRLSDLPTDQRYAIGRSDARPVSREAIIEAIGDTPELSDAKVIQSALELPPQALIGMVLQSVDPRDVRGMYIDGDLYVVADNVESVEDGVRAAIHEAVGHKGIRGVLGDQGHQLDRVMLSLYRSLPNHPTGRDILAEVRRDYPFLDPANREDRITIGEELVAHLLEKGYRPKAWHRAVAKIRDLLRRVFPSIGWTYTDVLALGEQSREWLRREKAMRDAEQAESVVTRYSKRKGENKLFTPIQQEAEAYRKNLKRALENRNALVPPISLGRTSPVLAEIGAPDLPMSIARSVVEKATRDKHVVPMSVIEQLPELLHDPVMVLDSATKADSLLVVVKASDSKGRQILVPLHLDKRQRHIRVNWIASTYGKDGAQRFLSRQIEQGRLRYFDTKQGPEWFQSSRLQLPGGGTPSRGLESGPEWLQSLRLQLPVEGVPQGPDSSVLTPEDIGNPEIRFALRGKPRVAFESQFDDFTDADRAAASKIGARTPVRSAISEAVAAVRDGNAMAYFKEKASVAALKIRQGMVDRVAALKELDEQLYGESALGENITRSSWVLARMSNAANGALHALLHNGRIRLDPKEKVITLQDGDSKGLGEVLGRLGSAAEIERFMGWIAGNRADKLRAEGRENLFKDADIDAMKSWNRGNLADGRSREAVYREVFEEFQAYRDDVLAVAEQSGIISKEQREMWRDDFYVPFYRLSEEKGAPSGQLGTAGLSRQQAYKKLKGGTQNLNDLLQNTMMNFHHLLDASLKNQAAVQAVENAKQLGMAEKVPESGRDTSKSTFVMEGGKKVFYEIDDPLVFQALTALAHPGMNSTAMKVMRGFKRVFTNLTTTTPQFMVANLIRDSLQATATNEVSKNAFKNVIDGAGAYRDQRIRAQMLASGASFNFGHLYGNNPDELRAQLTRGMRDAKLVDGPMMVPNLLRKGWSWWNDVNNTAENLNRAAIYAQNREGGELRAAFEARDLIDFSAHGAWPAVRVLIDIVPFLNARIQGLDKIYRSGVKPGASVVAEAFGYGKAGVTAKQAAARFWTVTGALTLATVALYLHNQDDEEYQKLEDWQKDTYWFFRAGDQAFFIPKPFEVGAMATLAERITEQFTDDQATGRVFRERLMHMMTDTFSFSPVPQMMQPALDIYANYDAFTGRPIESMGMDRLSPELRRRSGTSKVAEWISGALNSTVGAIGDPDKNPLALSPVQVDHLIGGYLGQVGTWVASSGDVAWRAATGVESPARRWYEFQPIRRFYRNLGDEDRYTRYGTVFYEGLREAGRAHADVKELREMGNLADAAEVARTNREMLALRLPLNRAQRRLRSINQQIDIIRRSSLDGEVKRQRIDRLNAVKNQIQRALGERVLEARAG
ncbi:hypothetical protein HPA02_27070 [Bisbaumannia pacifica]|uniref:Phage MuF C-terminal domain-containing protein n=1 Tax=Bisbaumannia pacifica TaxID=77098 RepID=A0A510XAG0_9GAMM|nr:LPD38 domain-containing protein [Halomonas pacifica]GEK48424.1 hypothetical protein HPA02_27070 [Halomonas pacifica]